VWNIRRLPRKPWLVIFAALLCTVIELRLGNFGMLLGAEPAPAGIVLEDFEKHGMANFPKNWWSGGRAQAVYRIEIDGDNRYLHARAVSEGVPIGLQHVFDPKKQQQLRWRWRVRALPVGADERNAEKHDAAAQVYVIFDNHYWPRVIKFIWSATLPVRSRFTNPMYDRGRFVVLRSGMPKKPGWYEEQVNFYDEYKKFFGNKPGQVQGIGILTSSDSTKSLAIADYDDFVLLP
jgi:Protein of unknown function (DUF3047)